MFRLSLAVLLAGTAVATAQPKGKAPPDPKAQLEAAVSKTLGGAPGTSYVVILVTETMDNGALKAGATILDIFTAPLRAMFWIAGSNSPLPWASASVDTKSWEAEVVVFADRKTAAEAVAAFGLAEQVPGTARTWRLLKKAEGLAAAVKLADTEQAKLDKQAKAGAKLTVSRRPDPAKK